MCGLWGEVSGFFFAGGGSEVVCGGVSVGVQGLQGRAWAVKWGVRDLFCANGGCERVGGL